MGNILITPKQLQLLIESQAEVDRILDKIYNQGMDALSIDEKNYLDDFSKHQGHPEDFVSRKEKIDVDYEKKGHSVISELPQLEGMEFVYEDSLEDDDFTQIAGDLYFDDETFFLMFAIDNNNDLVDYSASKEYMGSNDDLINYLVEKNPNMTYIQADTLISHYIENEIIPNLP
jgi:hypothetical protein